MSVPNPSFSSPSKSATASPSPSPSSSPSPSPSTSPSSFSYFSSLLQSLDDYLIGISPFEVFQTEYFSHRNFLIHFNEYPYGKEDELIIMKSTQIDIGGQVIQLEGRGRGSYENNNNQNNNNNNNSSSVRPFILSLCQLFDVNYSLICHLLLSSAPLISNKNKNKNILNSNSLSPLETQRELIGVVVKLFFMRRFNVIHTLNHMAVAVASAAPNRILSDFLTDICDSGGTINICHHVIKMIKWRKNIIQNKNKHREQQQQQQSIGNGNGTHLSSATSFDSLLLDPIDSVGISLSLNISLNIILCLRFLMNLYKTREANHVETVCIVETMQNILFSMERETTQKDDENNSHALSLSSPSDSDDFPLYISYFFLFVYFSLLETKFRSLRQKLNFVILNPQEDCKVEMETFVKNILTRGGNISEDYSYGNGNGNGNGQQAEEFHQWPEDFPHFHCGYLLSTSLFIRRISSLFDDFSVSVSSCDRMSSLALSTEVKMFTKIYFEFFRFLDSEKEGKITNYQNLNFNSQTKPNSNSTYGQGQGHGNGHGHGNLNHMNNSSSPSSFPPTSSSFDWPTTFAFSSSSPSSSFPFHSPSPPPPILSELNGPTRIVLSEIIGDFFTLILLFHWREMEFIRKEEKKMENSQMKIKIKMGQKTHRKGTKEGNPYYSAAAAEDSYSSSSSSLMLSSSLSLSSPSVSDVSSSVSLSVFPLNPFSGFLLILRVICHLSPSVIDLLWISPVVSEFIFRDFGDSLSLSVGNANDSSPLPIQWKRIEENIKIFLYQNHPNQQNQQGLVAKQQNHQWDRERERERDRDRDHYDYSDLVSCSLFSSSSSSSSSSSPLSPLFYHYISLLTEMSKTDLGSEKVHLLLQNSPKLNWENIFWAIGNTAEFFSAEQNQNTEKSQQKSSENLSNTPSLPLTIQHFSSPLHVVEGLLHLISSVTHSNPRVSKDIFHSSECKSIDKIFQLLHSKVPNTIKSAAMDVLTSFASHDSQVGNIIWDLIVRSQIIPIPFVVHGESNSNVEFSSPNHGGILFDLNEIESSARHYPLTLAFCRLILTLLSVSPSPPPFILNGIPMVFPLSPFFLFFRNEIFLKFNERKYSNQREKWEMAEITMAIMMKGIMRVRKETQRILRVEENGVPSPSPSPSPSLVSLSFSIPFELFKSFFNFDSQRQLVTLLGIMEEARGVIKKNTQWGSGRTQRQRNPLERENEYSLSYVTPSSSSFHIPTDLNSLRMFSHVDGTLIFCLKILIELSFYQREINGKIQKIIRKIHKQNEKMEWEGEGEKENTNNKEQYADALRYLFPSAFSLSSSSPSSFSLLTSPPLSSVLFSHPSHLMGILSLIDYEQRDTMGTKAQRICRKHLQREIKFTENYKNHSRRKNHHGDGDGEGEEEEEEEEEEDEESVSSSSPPSISVSLISYFSLVVFYILVRTDDIRLCHLIMAMHSEETICLAVAKKIKQNQWEGEGEREGEGDRVRLLLLEMIKYSLSLLSSSPSQYLSSPLSSSSSLSVNVNIGCLLLGFDLSFGISHSDLSTSPHRFVLDSLILLTQKSNFSVKYFPLSRVTSELFFILSTNPLTQNPFREFIERLDFFYFNFITSIVRGKKNCVSLPHNLLLSFYSQFGNIFHCISMELFHCFLQNSKGKTKGNVGQNFNFREFVEFTLRKFHFHKIPNHCEEGESMDFISLLNVLFVDLPPPSPLLCDSEFISHFGFELSEVKFFDFRHQCQQIHIGKLFNKLQKIKREKEGEGEGDGQGEGKGKRIEGEGEGEEKQHESRSTDSQFHPHPVSVLPLRVLSIDYLCHLSLQWNSLSQIISSATNALKGLQKCFSTLFSMDFSVSQSSFISITKLFYFILDKLSVGNPFWSAVSESLADMSMQCIHTMGKEIKGKRNQNTKEHEEFFHSFPLLLSRLLVSLTVHSNPITRKSLLSTFSQMVQLVQFSRGQIQITPHLNLNVPCLSSSLLAVSLLLCDDFLRVNVENSLKCLSFSALHDIWTLLTTHFPSSPRRIQCEEIFLSQFTQKQMGEILSNHIGATIKQMANGNGKGEGEISLFLSCISLTLALSIHPLGAEFLLHSNVISAIGESNNWRAIGKGNGSESGSRSRNIHGNISRLNGNANVPPTDLVSSLPLPLSLSLYFALNIFSRLLQQFHSQIFHSKSYGKLEGTNVEGATTAFSTSFSAFYSQYLLILHWAQSSIPMICEIILDQMEIKSQREKNKIHSTKTNPKEQNQIIPTDAEEWKNHVQEKGKDKDKDQDTLRPFSVFSLEISLIYFMEILLIRWKSQTVKGHYKGISHGMEKEMENGGKQKSSEESIVVALIMGTVRQIEQIALREMDTLISAYDHIQRTQEDSASLSLSLSLHDDGVSHVPMNLLDAIEIRENVTRIIRITRNLISIGEIQLLLFTKYEHGHLPFPPRSFTTEMVENIQRILDIGIHTQEEAHSFHSPRVSPLLSLFSNDKLSESLLTLIGQIVEMEILQNPHGTEREHLRSVISLTKKYQKIYKEKITKNIKKNQNEIFMEKDKDEEKEREGKGKREGNSLFTLMMANKLQRMIRGDEGERETEFPFEDKEVLSNSNEANSNRHSRPMPMPVPIPWQRERERKRNIL